MDVTKLKYPFGKCATCGKEFDWELRSEYEIVYCPWCGERIDDIFSITDSITQKIRENDIFCEECGVRIYQRSDDGKGGRWIEKARAGVCSGPCERELCGNCADWDVNGECEQCRTSPCGQCPNHGAVETCQNCEHLPERKKWADYEEPYHGACIDCPAKGCTEVTTGCKNPCRSCPMESDCYNDNTDKRSDCVAFSKFQKECEQENIARCNGGTNDSEEPVCEEYAENK